MISNYGNDKNILISSASAKVPLIKAVQKAAADIDSRIKVYTGDKNPNVVSRYYGYEFWEMPGTTDENLDKIISGCKDRKIEIVIPTRDQELLFWSENLNIFKKNSIDVIVSSNESVLRCYDKYSFSQFGDQFQLPFIQTELDIDEIREEKLVVKERYSEGSKKIGLNLTRTEAVNFSKELKNPIFQPFIVGEEISADAWIDKNGTLKGVVLRERNLVENGESKVTTTFKNIELENEIGHIFEELKLRGPIILQFLIDRNNKINIIECNCRFGGASTVSIKAGLDVFKWSLLESYNLDVGKIKFNRCLEEIRQIRIPFDDYINDIHLRP